MKKLVLLTLLFVSFIACNSDETKDEPKQDATIGVWKIDKVINNGIEATNGCDELSRLTFTDNGNFTIVRKVIADIDCTTIMDSGGTWTNTNNEYVIEFSEGGIDMQIRIENNILIEGDPAFNDSRVEWVKFN